MNRGSATARRTKPSAAPCFNEAPIHESGKFDHVLAYLKATGELQ